MRAGLVNEQKQMKRALLSVVLVLQGVAAMAYEEPDYDVVRSTDVYEVRRYAPYLVAEVDVEGSFRGAGNKAFRILAGYIFGDNQPRTKMNMTVPVESAAVGQTMNMTVPVESRSAGAGDEPTYTYAFVMERAYTMDSLPTPDDDRIRLVERPARTMAVVRYSGTWSASKFGKKTDELLAALREDGVDVIGDPVFARYNGPLTPWFLRRNEVMVEVRPSD